MTFQNGLTGVSNKIDIYLAGNAPEEVLTREEIGRNIAHYNHRLLIRHFLKLTPVFVYQVNIKTVLFQGREALQRTAETAKRPTGYKGTRPSRTR